MTEIEILNKKITDLETLVRLFIRADRFVFDKDIDILKQSGVRIGARASQKLSVYGVTPVVQASAIAQPNDPSGSYIQNDAQSAVDAINSIRTALKNIGITA